MNSLVRIWYSQSIESFQKLKYFHILHIMFHLNSAHAENDDQIQSRITCDIFNSNPACAMHCILQGYSGGWCDNRKVCRCR